jgi:putative membrane protein
MMWGFGDNLMGFGWFGGISMLIFWVLTIVGIVYLVKWLMIQSQETGGHSKTPLEILKERYAKGEISKEDFEKMKKDLE